MSSLEGKTDSIFGMIGIEVPGQVAVVDMFLLSTIGFDGSNGCCSIQSCRSQKVEDTDVVLCIVLTDCCCRVIIMVYRKRGGSHVHSVHRTHCTHCTHLDSCTHPDVILQYGDYTRSEYIRTLGNKEPIM